MRSMIEMRRLRLEVTPPNEWQKRYVSPELVNNLLGAKLQMNNYLPGPMLSETFEEIVTVHGQRVADKNRKSDVRAVVDLGTHEGKDKYLVVETFGQEIVVWPLELKRKRFVHPGVSSKRHKFNPFGTEHVSIMKTEHDGDMARYSYPRMMLGMNEKGQYAAMQKVRSWLDNKPIKNNEAAD